MKKLLFALVAVVPLWIVEFPPIQDLPNHVGRAHVILDLLTGGAAFGEEYRLVLLPLPNIAGDLLLVPLMALFPGVVAGKVVISGTLLLTAYAGFRFLRAAGAPEMGWLGLALLWTWFVHTGFLSFLISVPLVLLALAHRFRREDRWGGKERLVFGLLATATYFAHLFSFLFLVAAVQLRKARRGRPRDLLRLEPGLIPGLVLWAVVFVAGYLEGGGTGWINYEDPGWKAWLLANLYRGYFPVADLVLTALVVAGTVYAARKVRRGRLLAVWVALALFLALPRSALDGYWVDARVLPFLAWFLLAALRGHPRRARVAGVALLLLTTAWTGFAFVRSGREIGRMVRAADLLPRGVKIVPLTEKKHDGEVETYHHLVTWIVSRRDAVTPHLFAKRFQHPVRSIRHRPAPHEYWFKSGMPAPDWDLLLRDWDFAWLTGEKAADGQARRHGSLVIEEGPLRIYRLERPR